MSAKIHTCPVCPGLVFDLRSKADTHRKDVHQPDVWVGGSNNHPDQIQLFRDPATRSFHCPNAHVFQTASPRQMKSHFNRCSQPPRPPPPPPSASASASASNPPVSLPEPGRRGRGRPSLAEEDMGSKSDPEDEQAVGGQEDGVWVGTSWQQGARWEIEGVILRTRTLDAVSLVINIRVGILLSTDRQGVYDIKQHFDKHHPALNHQARKDVVIEVDRRMRIGPVIKDGPYGPLARPDTAHAHLAEPGQKFEVILGLAVFEAAGCRLCSGAFQDQHSYRTHRLKDHPTAQGVKPFPAFAQRLTPQANLPAFVVHNGSENLPPPSTAPAALLAQRTALQQLRPPPVLHSDASNYDQSVFDQVLNYGKFLRPYPHELLLSLVTRPHIYLPNSPTLLHLRDKMRNLSAHVEHYTVHTDPALEAHDGTYGICRAIAKGDGRQGTGTEVGPEDPSMLSNSDGPFFKHRLQDQSLKAYSSVLTRLISYCLRTCPAVPRPATPLNSDGTAPAPTTVPEEIRKSDFTEAVHFPSLKFSSLEVEATEKLRAALQADLALQPRCTAGGKAGDACPVQPSPAMQDALLGFCTSIFCVYYEHEPARGETMLDRFRMILALSDEGGFRPARVVTPILAKLEFAMRLTVLKGIVREVGSSDGPVQARSAADGPFENRKGVGSRLLNFVTARASAVHHTPFSQHRLAVHPIWAAAKAEHNPPAIETVLDPEHPDILLPILVNKVYLSLTSVRKVIQSLIVDIKAAIRELAPEVSVGEVGLSFSAVPHFEPGVDQSLFDDERVRASLGLRDSEHDLFGQLGQPEWTQFIDPSDSDSIKSEASARWRATYGRLVMMLVLLVQLGAPGTRGTEFLQQRLTKSADFASSLGFHSRCLTLTSYKNKNGRKTIIRFIPPFVARLVIITFGVLHPFFVTLLDFTQTSVNTDPGRVARALLWTDANGKVLTSDKVSESMSRRFAGKIGQRNIRQAMTHFCKVACNLGDSPILDPFAVGQAEQGGHSLATEGTHYGNASTQEGAMWLLEAQGELGAALACSNSVAVLVGLRPNYEDERVRAGIEGKIRPGGKPKSPKSSNRRAPLSPETDHHQSKRLRTRTPSPPRTPRPHSSPPLIASPEYARAPSLDAPASPQPMSSPLPVAYTPPPAGIVSGPSSSLVPTQIGRDQSSSPIVAPPMSLGPTFESLVHTLLVRWSGMEPRDVRLKPGQIKLAVDVLRGERDLMVMAPVGWGKTFMMVLPALALNKLVLLISPFKSLTTLLPSRAKPSGLRTFSLPLGPDITITSLTAGLVIVPFESLAVPDVLETITALFKTNRIASVAIDEAHVPVQTKSYRQSLFGLMGVIRQGPVPIHLYSGTLPPSVQDQLAKGIHTTLSEIVVHNLPARRVNIQFDIEYLPPVPWNSTSAAQRRALIQRELANHDFEDGDVIIFVGTVEEAKLLPDQITEDLRTQSEEWPHDSVSPAGWNGAGAYYSVKRGPNADAEAAMMTENLRDWEAGELSILVSTKGGKQALDNQLASLAIVFDGTDSVLDMGQTLGRVGRAPEDPARVLLAVPSIPAGWKRDTDDPPWTLPARHGCLHQSLEKQLGVPSPPTCEDLLGGAAQCSGCRSRSSASNESSWSHPDPAWSPAPPLVPHISPPLFTTLVPRSSPHGSIHAASRDSIAQKTQFDTACGDLAAAVGAVESTSCAGCVSAENVLPYLRGQPEPPGHEMSDACNMIFLGCRLNCRGEASHKRAAKCPLRRPHSLFNDSCTWCFLPIFAHPAGHQGGLGVDCPLSAKYLVVHLVLYIQTDSDMLSLCNNAGIMLQGTWDKERTMDWLGTMSTSPLPFTNGTLLFLWFARRASLID